MDPDRFDSLTRHVRVVTSRRSVIGGLSGALAAIVGTGAAGVAAKPRRRNRLGAQGPCGNGGGKANRCRRNRDCCTGLCQPVAKAKHGRCRCQRWGQSCTEDRNCCQRRGQDMVCRDQICQDPLVCGNGGPCTIFITSGRYPGNFGGLGQADDICQFLADAAGSLAPAGTYRAWLSDSTTSAGERLAHSSGPYVLVNGTVVADNWDALTNTGSEALQASITQSETGLGVSSLVWTNTLADGTQFSNLPTTCCFDWTSGAPDPRVVTGRGGYSGNQAGGWTDQASLTCVSINHLYCLQQS